MKIKQPTLYQVQLQLEDLLSRVNNAINLLHTFVRENPDKLLVNIGFGVVKPTDDTTPLMMNMRTITDDGILKTSELLAKCKKLFPIYSYYKDDQLDEYFPPVKTSFKYRNVQEADEELANMSANDLKEKKIAGLTLRERLIYELAYFKETGNHLDVVNITLCSGSRDPDGGVPCVYWYYGRLCVDWYYPTSARGSLRSRARL